MRRKRGNMEIERKFLIKQLPENLEAYECLQIEQAYLCRRPVIRIRKQNEEYWLTYKGEGLMVREEYNLPLDEESYGHLLLKADGRVIKKKRYKIPIEQGLVVELDVFEGFRQGLIMAEVEFVSEEQAGDFREPDWFGEEVTYNKEYHNNYLSQT